MRKLREVHFSVLIFAFSVMSAIVSASIVPLVAEYRLPNTAEGWVSAYWLLVLVCMLNHILIMDGGFFNNIYIMLVLFQVYALLVGVFGLLGQCLLAVALK